MLEIEIKASLANIDKHALLSALSAAGFVPGKVKEETDLYYNGIERDYRKTDEALRLRSSRTLSGSAGQADNAKAHITYKGSKVDSRSQTRPELETAIGELETMKAILEKLGFPVVMTVKKQRAYFHKGKVTVCLDEVECLGSFIELEQVEDVSDEKKEAVIDQLLSLLNSFGVPRENLLQKSYLELLMAAATS